MPIQSWLLSLLFRRTGDPLAGVLVFAQSVEGAGAPFRSVSFDFSAFAGWHDPRSFDRRWARRRLAPLLRVPLEADPFHAPHILDMSSVSTPPSLTAPTPCTALLLFLGVDRTKEELETSIAELAWREAAALSLLARFGVATLRSGVLRVDGTPPGAPVYDRGLAGLAQEGARAVASRAERASISCSTPSPELSADETKGQGKSRRL